MARGRSGGGSRSGGGRAGGSRSSSRSSMSRSGGGSLNSSRSSFGSSNRSSVSRSGYSGSFSTGHSGTPAGSSTQAHRSSAVRPSGNYTSHRPDARRPVVIIQKPGIPIGRYTHRQTASGQSVQNTENTTNQGATVSNQTKRRSGCLTSFLTVAAWCLVLMLIFWVIAAPGSDSGSEFTPSTVKREKLHLNLSDAAGYCTDECGWIDNHTVLEKGLKEFYASTGILPYVYIIDNVDGDYDPSTEKLELFAEEAYAELFEDGGHALLVFWDYSNAYEYVLWLGEDAAELMDTEACDILFDCLDYYYYEDIGDEAFFANAFAEAGERMMRVDQTSGTRIGIALLIAGIVLVIYLVYRRMKKRKAEEEARRKRAEEILNTPLEKFGENGDVIDDLEKKYEKEI